MMISFILLFLISSSILVYLILTKKVQLLKKGDWQNKKQFYQGEKEGRIKAIEGMIFDFSVLDKKEEGCKNLKKGAKHTEIKDYGVFSLSVTLKQMNNLSVYEVSHTHIVPQWIQCYLKRKSVISICKNGYIECVEGQKVGFLLFGAKAVKVEKRRILFSLQDKAYIVSKEGGLPTLSSVKEFLSIEKNPFLIKTPDQKLNFFFNDWLWEIIVKGKKKNFASALLLCAIKLITDADSCREFLKSAFFEKVEDKYKWCALIMICEGEKVFDKSILQEKVGDKKLLEHIYRRIFSNDYTLEEKACALIRLYAMSEFSQFLQNAQEKINLLNFIERESERLNIKREEILSQKDRYIYTCFNSENALAERLANSSVKEYVNVLNEYNPLNRAPIPSFETATLCYIAILKNLYGIRKKGVGFSFAPEFPNLWQSAKINYKKEGKTVSVQLDKGEQNLLVVDGVEYGGFGADFFPKRGGKYKLIFKE